MRGKRAGSTSEEVNGIDFSGSQNNTNRHERERGFGRGGGEVEGDSGQHVSWTYVKLSSKNTFNYNKSRVTNKSCFKVRTTTRKSQKEVLDMPIKESDVLKKILPVGQSE